jgi:hypothetical protein
VTLAISAVAPVLLAAYAALLLWRTAVERGYVGEPPTPLQIALRRLGAGVRLAFAAMGAALTPVMLGFTEAFGQWKATTEAIRVAYIRERARSQGLDPERVLALAADLARTRSLTLDEAADRLLAKAARDPSSL